MSLLTASAFGNLPGMGSVVETFEAAVAWGPYPRYFVGAWIASTAVDAGNSPTTTLRPGLVMGKQISTGQWTNYSPTAADGSEVAAGVLVTALRIQDVSTQTNVQKSYAVMVSGGVQASKLLGLDNMARAQMSGHFIFDDFVPGNVEFQFQRFQTKTTSYQIVAADNLSHFDNLGAVGAVTFTLPPIANGYQFFFTAMAAQNLIVASTEGANMVTFNNASANSVAFQTGGNIIGGSLNVYSNPAATKWIVEPSGSNTLTVA